MKKISAIQSLTLSSEKSILHDMTLAAILNKEFQPVLDLRIGFEKLVHLIYYAYLWQPLQFWNL